MTIGAGWHRPFTQVRAGLVVLLCLSLMPGCSGGTDPAGADLRTGNPSRGDISQNPAIRMEDEPGFSSQESLTGPKKLWVDDEVLVVLREGLGQSDVASKLAGFPVRLKKTIHCR